MPYSEIEAADQTFYITQSECTDTGPTSPSADPITPDSTKKKIHEESGNGTQVCRFLGGHLNHKANEAVWDR